MEYGVLTASVSNEEGDIVNINGRRYQSQREKDNDLEGIFSNKKGRSVQSPWGEWGQGL